MLSSGWLMVVGVVLLLVDQTRSMSIAAAPPLNCPMMACQQPECDTPINREGECCPVCAGSSDCCDATRCCIEAVDTDNNNEKCTSMRCPEIRCKDSITNPGECCPQCIVGADPPKPMPIVSCTTKCAVPDCDKSEYVSTDGNCCPSCPAETEQPQPMPVIVPVDPKPKPAVRMKKQDFIKSAKKNMLIKLQKFRRQLRKERRSRRQRRKNIVAEPPQPMPVEVCPCDKPVCDEPYIPTGGGCNCPICPADAEDPQPQLMPFDRQPPDPMPAAGEPADCTPMDEQCSTMLMRG